MEGACPRHATVNTTVCLSQQTSWSLLAIYPQLDVLACNTFGGGTVGGEVLVNGAPRRREEFSQMSC